MARVRPALAALLLVAASVGVGVVAAGDVTAPVQPSDDPVVGVSENTTRVLVLTEADAADFGGPTPAVTKVLSTGYADLTADYRRNQLEQRLAAADNESQRQAVLRNGTDWVETQVTALVEREREARAAYQAGDLTTTEYLTVLGAVHERAGVIQSYIGIATDPDSNREFIYQYASGVTDTQSRLRTLYARAAALRGPVSQRVAAVVSGDRDELRLHVTTGDGVMLSTIDRGVYYRQTYRPGNYDVTTEDSVNDLEALQSKQSFYPWAVNHSTGANSLNEFGEGAFRFITEHRHGNLVAFFDSSTRKVFVERQELRLSQLPATYDSVTSASNTTLRVSRTYAGGPVQVRVENATGAPVDAPVTLNGTAVGRTGADGELWAVSPAGEYVVSTSRNGDTLNATVTANPAPPRATEPTSTAAPESRASPEFTAAA